MASLQIGHRQLRHPVFCACCIVIILLGAVMTFLWQVHDESPTRAASGDVVGPPTLPAATVDTILTSMGSPMAGTGAVVEEASRRTNIDDAFALAVWWTETNDGAAGVGLADRNPGSVRGGMGYPVAFDNYTIYPSYAAAITDWFNLLRNHYVNSGLTSAYTICYPYVGTSNSYQWAIKVVNLMERYHGEAPPPPTPTPIVIPTPNAVRIQHTQIHVVKPGLAMTGTTHEAHTEGDVVPPVIIKQAVPTALSTRSSAPSPPLFIILPGILAALLIALWGLRIGWGVNSLPRASLTPERPVRAFTPPNLIALPPLYVNEFSPVLAPQTEQLFPVGTDGREGQSFATFSNGNGNGNGMEGGLRKRYADTDALPKRTLLRPVRMEREQVRVQGVSEDGTGYGVAPISLVAMEEHVRVIEERVPELVMASGRPMGLLGRYAMERRGSE